MLSTAGRRSLQNSLLVQLSLHEGNREIYRIENKGAQQRLSDLLAQRPLTIETQKLAEKTGEGWERGPIDIRVVYTREITPGLHDTRKARINGTIFNYDL